MPLAIVLAAAWIDTLSVDEIASEIEKSIDLLETEKRDVPGRQRSVRAVIEVILESGGRLRAEFIAAPFRFSWRLYTCSDTRGGWRHPYAGYLNW